MATLSPHPDLSERRKHKRVELRALAHVFRGSEVIRITTQNISIGGFYGRCYERFACGEQFNTLLDIGSSPAEGFGQLQSSGARFRCMVRVVRVEEMKPEGPDDAMERFGVAFAVETYQVL
jgi:hypothetical protein